MYLILTCAKAFYIIAEFMHLRHEIKNLIMTVAVPATLFIWFIIAFLWDGNSYRELRNRYDRHHYEMQKEKAPPAEGEEGHEPAAKKPGAAE
jgi:cytochrome c oxidase subunit 4